MEEMGGAVSDRTSFGWNCDGTHFEGVGLFSFNLLLVSQSKKRASFNFEGYPFGK